VQPEQLVLPAIATAALGTALLVPLRDDRRGKRATLSGMRGPLRADFGTVASNVEPLSISALEATPDAAPHWTGRLHALAVNVRTWIEGQSQVRDIEHAGEETSSESVIERSFADTLSALLIAGNEVEAAPGSAPLEAAVAEGAVVGPLPRTTVERAVPLTRMPLRPQGDAITWSRSIPGCALDSRSERHAYLRDALEEPSETLDAMLVAAYREEDPTGRILALRALHRGAFPSAHAALIDALNVGSDEERVFAVDALLEAGAGNDVTPAFSDRLEAIAARAALGYVGHATRSAYAEVLNPFVDQSRIDAILALLAGAIE
jgi:hypothetical protein